jgi:hypothetical protein
MINSRKILITDSGYIYKKDLYTPEQIKKIEDFRNEQLRFLDNYLGNNIDNPNNQRVIDEINKNIEFGSRNILNPPPPSYPMYPNPIKTVPQPKPIGKFMRPAYKQTSLQESIYADL